MQFFYCKNEARVETINKNKFQVLYIAAIWEGQNYQILQKKPVLDS